MNESDIGWLLQTIEDSETAERFVAAQYQRGRILSGDDRHFP